jgi:hypothetical protein
MGFAKKIPGAKSFLKFTAKTSGLRALVGGEQFGNMDLAGQVFGVYDDRYKPKEVDATPSASVETQAYAARDNMRRLARRATGRDSTVRTGPGGAPYSAAPKSLLGS